MKRESSVRQTRRRGLAWAILGVLAGLPSATRADVKVPAIFGSHMVLQRDQKNRVWGWAEPGEEITVKIAGQTHATKAGGDGSWQVMLDAMPAGGPHVLSIQGKNTINLDDVLVGEVWLCSGQSNMQWPLFVSRDADLEIATAKYPNIRLITVPNFGTQEAQKDFRGEWQTCRSESAAGFSAIGYFFGRQLHQTLGVPVGLINDAWGGSACEAWIRRDVLAADPKYDRMLKRWEQFEKDYPRAKTDYDSKHAEWKLAADKAKGEGKQPPPEPGNPEWMMGGNFRPGNIYNGVLKPTIGYGIRGVIWYQGETNAGKAYQYRDLFPLMIKSWRDAWGQGDFSFYWVQLADFLPESAEPKESAWAELREAQTMTMSRLPKTGEAVIIDLGDAQDIHPRNKHDVATRLARWALAQDYGLKFPYHSPIYKSMEKQGNKVVLQFDHVGSGLKAGDVPDVRGFAIAGADHKFVNAKARISGPPRLKSGRIRYLNPRLCAMPGPTIQCATFTATRACH